MRALATPLSGLLSFPWHTSRSAFDELFPDPVATEVARATAAGWKPDTPDLYCPRCGASTGPGAQYAGPSVHGRIRGGCAYCAGRRLPWDRLVRLGPYHPPLNHWIVAMKFSAIWSWSDWFGRQLASCVDVLPPVPAPVPPIPGASSGASPLRSRSLIPSRGTLVCPTPMPFRRRWRRGYNQAHLIALAFGHARDWNVASPLYRTRHTPPQTSLPPSARLANVRRSFGIRNVDLTGLDVWLIDDVKTTGSTLRGCARLLRRRGARTISVAVAAVADPRQQDFQAI